MALFTSILTGGVNNHTTTSEEANGLATDFVSNGVVGPITNTNSTAPMTGAFAVNAQGSPNMTVAVTTGVAYVKGTPSGQSGQTFRVRLSANENVTIQNNTSGSTKYDFVYIAIDATKAANPNLAGDDVASLAVSRSTSNSVDNGTPPTYGYCIAIVTVANGATSITNGNIRDNRIKSEVAVSSSALSTGWIEGTLPQVSSVTANGNGSYDINFASSVASILSEGMRLRITKSVAGNGYMGGLFNGSSHYFTKTSPSGTLGTVTNNLTLETNYQLDAYPATRKYIGGRADSTPNNGFGIAIEPSGQVLYAIFNGGIGNSRAVRTYQSLPLNKKTHIAVSHTGSTILIYLNGVAVPTATTTAGTAPTTAGTGGDFSIGRFGAYTGTYTTGYISNVAVFDAVLSAATIRQHSTYKLIGNETNCIGAWSLDNTPNDQSSAGNNLTATGGVGYTAMSPHGQLGNGVDTTKAVALIMAVSGSTATVQVPEGCTIPTTGGVSAVAYSTQANPYGWVSDKGRWEITSYVNQQNLYTAGTSWGSGVNGPSRITAPVGAFNITGEAVVYLDRATTPDQYTDVTISSTGSSETDSDTTKIVGATLTGFTGNIFMHGTFYSQKFIKNSSATNYWITTKSRTATGIQGTVKSKLAIVPSGL